MNNIFREQKPLYPSIKYKNSLDFPSHLHDDIELVYIIKGNGFAYCDAQQYKLKEGSFFIAFPNQIHSYKGFDKDDFLVFSAIIKPSLLLQYEQDFLECIPKCNLYNYPKNDPDNLLAIINYFMNEFDTCSHDILQDYLTIIFGKILKHYSLHKRTVANDSISEILTYCNKHYTEQISVSSIAKALNISESYISYIFNKRLFIHFCEYINSLRVSEAKNMLLFSKESITNIASSTGFNTLRTFNRVFYKQMGKTPSQYRKDFLMNKKNLYIKPSILPND